MDINTLERARMEHGTENHIRHSEDISRRSGSARRIAEIGMRLSFEIDLLDGVRILLL